MPNNLTDAEIALAAICILFGLSLLVWLDRYLTRRRSAVMNADHLARMQAQASDYPTVIGNAPRFQKDGWEVRASEWSEQAFSMAGAHIHSFSRRRVVHDSLGRVMAVHYEEILAPDFSRVVRLPQTQRTLSLAPAA